jgi:putative AdoMet-dependent methyltransferase
MKDPFPASSFDDWAETYDQTVLDVGTFPFTGYDITIKTMIHLVEPRPGLSVLDLGTGTGNLALPLTNAGCILWCTDFSVAMLSKARQKIPEAHLFLHDLRLPFPHGLERSFDRIVSAYVFHHFDLDKKVSIIKNLCVNHLTPDGTVIIGDIAFPDRTRRDKLRVELDEKWEEEFYLLADESLPALEKTGMSVRYEQVSPCAGIFVIYPASI